MHTAANNEAARIVKIRFIEGSYVFQYRCRKCLVRDAQIRIYFALLVSKLINNFLVKKPTNTAMTNAMQ